MCPTTLQTTSCWHPSWLNKAGTTRKDLESEGLAKNNPETDFITIKPKTASHVTEQFSWVPLPSCSLPGRHFPIKSLALSAHVSPQTIHVWVLDKSPVSGPGKGPLLQHSQPKQGHAWVLHYACYWEFGPQLYGPNLKHAAFMVSKRMWCQLLGWD